MKSNILHSSVSLFSTGVPVIAIFISDFRDLIARVCAVSGFLIFCASSTTTIPHVFFFISSTSIRIIAYVVRITSHFKSSFLSIPWYVAVFNEGANIWSSFIQFPISVVGQTTRTGFFSLFSSFNFSIRLITCIVLPSPISSAIQHPNPFEILVHSHLRPVIW